MSAALAASTAVMLVAWLVSLRRRDASVADVAWGVAFVAATLAATRAATPRAVLAIALVSVWGLRLSLYLAWRARGRGEDARYAAMRRAHGDRFPWVSLFTVFLLQAALATAIALPVLVAVARGGALGWLDAAGAAVWLAGFVVETTADLQLARWKRDATSRGRILDRGLWGRSRHPNYFGEAVLWWGLGLLGVAAGAWWTLAGPALITFLLLRVSGVPLLERGMAARPGWADYVARTRAFLPLRRRISLKIFR
jgi:steroid 5-alpha reductase family enzyme